MNTRLMELAEQATIQEGSHGAFGEPTINEYVDLDKFAELIVKECRVALQTMLRDQISRGHAYKLIEEHFGVK